LGSEFLPELNEGALYMTFTLPPNISLSEGRRLVPRLTKLITAEPVVAEIQSQLGRPEDGTDATLPNNLEFFVKLKPPDEWPKGVDGLPQVIASLQAAIAEVPGVEVNFSQPIRDNVNENISGQFGQIAVKLYGDDLVTLQAHAERVKDVISDVEGVADLGSVESGKVPQILVSLDRRAHIEITLDLLRQFLKKRRSGAATTRAGRNLRRKGTQPQSLQYFLTYLNLQNPVPVRLGCQRRPDRVTNPLIQKNPLAQRRRHNALGPHPGFSQTQMQRIIAALRQLPVDRNQILHTGYLG
jgi:Cu/Ag efflux pump CusA